MRKIVMMFGAMVTVVLTVTVLGAQDCPCIWVDPEVPLQAQIDAALPGSTLCLPRGTWSEAIIIDKPLTLRGEGPGQTIITALPEDPLLSEVIWVRGPWQGQPISVAIEGLTLDGRVADVGLAVNAGLRVDGMAQVMLHNCHILDAHGILLLGSAQAAISNVTTMGRLRHGIELRGSAEATVIETTVVGTDYGVVLWESARITIIESIIEAHDTGVYASGRPQVVIIGTRIAGSRIEGIVLREEARALVVNSTIADNQAHGVVVGHRASVVLVGNVIAGNAMYGVLATLHDPCLPLSPGSWFAGSISGANNTIPGPEKPEGNLYGAVCPEVIFFLTTESGGVYRPYPRR
jgi:nitrous oxidase accessory protein NosD